MEIVTMRQLLESGVHFGHQTKRWNPKMKKFIFTSRNGIHVIDLQQTSKLIKKTYEFVKELARKGGTVLFVGTKKQAQEAIKLEADNCSMPYVNHRWLGGSLTNNVTIRKSINKLKQFQKMEEEGGFKKLSNKEAARKTKMLGKLQYNFEGIRNMVATPDAIFIVDTKREQLAVKEANKLGIPIIGVVDTNADPTEVQHPIPANDDAIRAIKLISSIMAKAVIEGTESRVQESAEASEKDIEEAMLKGEQEEKKGEKRDGQKEQKKEEPKKAEIKEKTPESAKSEAVKATPEVKAPVSQKAAAAKVK